VLTALAVVFVFGLLVMVHEFGHYIVARLNGIKVLEFAFGFGPKIVGFKGKETNYSLRLVPLGGFVRLYGMDAEIDENGVQTVAPSTDPRSYSNKRVWQRMSVIAAGPLMNFVLAIVLFMLVFAYYGIPTAATGNTIGSLVEGMPAQTLGIQEGDRIISVDGVQTPDWNTLTELIHSKPGQEILLVVEHAGKQQALKIKTNKDPQSGNGMIGISPEVIYQKTTILESARYGLERTVEFTRYIMVTLGHMITREVPADVGGPVAIAQAIGQGAEQGFANLLGLTGILSIQLGLLNLFPIPALDGSHLLFLLIEGVRGRPINPERQNLVNFIGFVFLLALMLVVTYQDILKLITKG
jgi:regulator of sigma E protease